MDQHSNEHRFSLSIVVAGLERVICEPVLMNLFIDAHQLSFSALCVELIDFIVPEGS